MNACDKNILLVRGNFFTLIDFINIVNCRKFCMHIGKVAQKSVLLSKTLGVKRGGKECRVGPLLAFPTLPAVSVLEPVFIIILYFYS